jgi:hypothetical protein
MSRRRRLKHQKEMQHEQSDLEIQAESARRDTSKLEVLVQMNDKPTQELIANTSRA